jgi:hypothetical protein
MPLPGGGIGQVLADAGVGGDLVDGCAEQIGFYLNMQLLLKDGGVPSVREPSAKAEFLDPVGVGGLLGGLRIGCQGHLVERALHHRVHPGVGEERVRVVPPKAFAKVVKNRGRRALWSARIKGRLPALPTSG